MNRTSNRDAFTLVELLTVIAIIGILAALIFPAIKSSMTKAEIVRAQAGVRTLETVFKAYQNEYGRLPATTTDANGIMTTTNGLVALLRGEDINITEGNITYAGNPKRIPFIEFKAQDLAINPSNNTTNFVDPWRKQYEFIVDSSYSNLATNPFNNPVTSVHADFLIWSAGPDAQELGYWQSGAKEGQGVNKDNVQGW